MNPTTLKKLSRKQWIYTTFGSVGWGAFVLKITSHLPTLEFLIYAPVGFVSIYFLWKSLDIYNKAYTSEEEPKDFPQANDSGGSSLAAPK